MQVDFARLSDYHQLGKVRHSVHPDRDLHVWCYSQATVFSRDWDDLTRLCRGLVTDGEGVVISRPYPKFFNWGEPLAPGPEITQGPFQAFDKEDGSLIVVGLDVDGAPVVSTKGSFTTWHSEVARGLLGGWKPAPGTTALFEFIHPQNRIVIDYGDREALVLLGAVSNEDGCDHFTPEQYADESGWPGDLAKPRAFNLQNILRTVQDPENGPNREGFVLIWPNPLGPSTRVKIKFAQYMQLHATLSRLSNVAVWEALSTGTFDALLEAVPDEMYEKVRECADELSQAFAETCGHAFQVAEKARLLHDTRANQARYILSQKDIESSLVFAALDSPTFPRDPRLDKRVWAKIKPERDATWTFLK